MGIKKNNEMGYCLLLILGLCLSSPLLILNKSNIVEAGKTQAFLAASEDSLFRPIKKNNIENLQLNASNALSVLVDFEKNKDKILYAKNENSPAPIASMSKLMTAIIAIEQYDLEDDIIINKENALALNKTGLNIKTGDRISLNNLLQIMLIESNNAAAEALTQKMGRDNFIAEMNKKSKDLGLINTIFYNPSGLDISDAIFNISTPKDLEKIAVYIIQKQPLIGDICSIEQIDVYVNGKLLKHLENTNILLKSSSDYLWGKTGYTEEANGCIILILKRPFSNIKESSNTYIINIIMGADGKINRFLEAQKMENWIINSFIW
ncbi:MAG: serine hydrolase [Candidatus Paceibacterota bacterium]|jgi:D-alanyl-D-alanine endopeptidase (penicillin-binding protein 7)